MAINKVVYNNNTLVDLTSDNVAQSDVRSGVYFHTKDGVRRQGTSSAIVPSGNINIATTNSVNVTNYATAQVVDSNLVAGNIKNGVNILGVNGTYAPSLETKSVTLGASAPSTLTPSSGKDGMSQVNFSLDSSVIKAENIAQGSTILGVQGTHSGGVTPTGSISITQNGTYDVTNYASANVNVSGGGGLDRADFASVTIEDGGLALKCYAEEFPQSETMNGVGVFIKGMLLTGYTFNIYAGTNGDSLFGIIVDQNWQQDNASGMFFDNFCIITFNVFMVGSVSEAYMFALS